MSSSQEPSDISDWIVRRTAQAAASGARQAAIMIPDECHTELRCTPVLSFFIQDLREGGAERNVVRLLNGIVARGISADLVVVRKQGAFFSELDGRVNIVELAKGRTAHSVLRLKSYIEQRRPAALVSSLTHTNVAAILANRAAARPTRLLVVERNQFSLNRERKCGLVGLSYRLVPWLYRWADVVACVSAGVREDLTKTVGISRDRTIVLYNPVVSPSIETLAKLPLAHKWYNDSQIAPLILGVGRFTRQKNFSLLIEAVAKVLEQRPVRLVLLGEGELRPNLEALIENLGIADHVDLPGFDSNPFRYMRSSAVYVLSSDWEGLPTSLIEAMACGTPVIATDCDSGPREILENGKFGRIVPKNNVGALAQAIVETLDDPGDRQAVIARAREFNLERAVDCYLEAVGWKQ